MESPKPCRNPYWEVECYLQKAEDEITRSFHELAGVGLIDSSSARPPSPPQSSATSISNVRYRRRRRSSADDNITRSHSTIIPTSFAISSSYHPAIDRRSQQPPPSSSRNKRFTRLRQPHRRSYTAEVGNRRRSSSSSSGSSSDDESSSIDAVPATFKPSSHFRPGGAARRAAHHRNRTSITTTTPASSLNQPQPPIERRYNRRLNNRTLVDGCQIVNYGSSGYSRNNQLLSSSLQKRSMSVRELPNSGGNGAVAPGNTSSFDFANKDSVTRWTSQMLIELDSLPSSQHNLSTGQHSSNETEQKELSSAPIPPNRTTSLPKYHPHRIIVNKSTVSGQLAKVCGELMNMDKCGGTSETIITTSNTTALILSANVNESDLDNNDCTPVSPTTTAPLPLTGTCSMLESGYSSIGSKKTSPLMNIAECYRYRDTNGGASRHHTSSTTSPLSTWKRRAAETRATAASIRMDIVGQQQLPQQSVHRIVASLIKTAEETAAKTTTTTTDHRNDTESTTVVMTMNRDNDDIQKLFDHQQHDVETQTSPFSLSRSSSFDWICDPDEDEEQMLQLRIPAPDECSADLCSLGSSITSDERQPNLSPIADDKENCLRNAEVMTKHIDNHQREIDDSIAMLMEYAGTTTMSSTTSSNNTDNNNHRCVLKFDTFNNDDFLGADHSLSSPTTSASMTTCSSTIESTIAANKISKRPSTKVERTTYISLMNDSMYDNVPEIRRQLMLSSKNADIDREESWRIGAEISSTIDSIDNLLDIPRDLSISSGLLADSESSPLSPDNRRRLSSNRRVLLLNEQQNRSVESNNILRNDHRAVVAVETTVPSASPIMRQKMLQQQQSTFSTDATAANARNHTNNNNNATTIVVIDRAGSCEQLDGQLLSQGSDSGFSSSKEKVVGCLEVEALECCKWLRVAGFPQYAKMYEDQLFPIDIESVARDHEFLDRDSLNTLFRRLNTLNRCASMKVDSGVVLRSQLDEESDDDEHQIAISRRWRYQRKSKTWSRIAEEFGYDNNESMIMQLKQQLTDVDKSSSNMRYNQQPKHRLTPAINNNNNQHQMVHEIAIADRVSSAENVNETGGVVGGNHKTDRKLQRSQSERIKERARAIIKRMDIRSSSKKRNNTRTNAIAHQQSSATIEIGDPVLISHFSATAQQNRVHNSIVDNSTIGVAMQQQQPARDKRWGMILPNSPDYTTGVNCFDDNKLYQHHQKSPHSNHSSTTSSSSLTRSTIRTNAYVTPPPSASAICWTSAVSQSHSPQLVNINRPSVSLRPVPLAGTNCICGDGSSNRLNDYDMHRISPAASLNRSTNVNTYQSHHPSQSPELIKQPSKSTPTVNGANSYTQRSFSSLDGSSDMSDTAAAKLFEMTASTTTTATNVGDRRDSGVGSSLSRSPSGTTGVIQRQRNAVLLASSTGGTPTAISSSSNCTGMLPTRRIDASSINGYGNAGGLALDMDALSVSQLVKLRKLAYLKLTALIERYSPTAGRGGVRNWDVKKLIRKIKSPESKMMNKSTEHELFGVPLVNICQRSGLALPRCILEAIHFLRLQAPETVGIFRKNGVRSRIAALKEQCRQLNAADSTPVPFESSQVHDVADFVKQYFRDLPESLMTHKMSETFTTIHMYIPVELRLEAMQNAVLLLPDENREALQTLLFFLNDIAYYSDANHMTAQNLAVCFAPSLFQLSNRLNAISPTRRHKTIGVAGFPSERELKENQAAQCCLSLMIDECRRLFTVPKSVFDRFYMDAAMPSPAFEFPTLQELGRNNGTDDGFGGVAATCNYRSYLLGECRDLLKDHHDRWKGWFTEMMIDDIEVSSKKSSCDSHPLRYYRVWTDIEAPPKELLARVLRERSIWDETTINCRVLSTLSEHCEVYQHVINDTPPHPTRDCVVVRLWRSGLKDLRGGCILVERSIASGDALLLGGVRACVLASKCLIEPCGAGRSRTTFISRVDLRGRGTAWYSKVYCHTLARQMARLRDSFRQVVAAADDGPETKV